MNTTALLILYNPYYQNDVIESHLEILKLHGKVSFGKIKSKMRNPHLEIMQSDNTDTESSIMESSTNKDSSLALALSSKLNINAEFNNKRQEIAKSPDSIKDFKQDISALSQYDTKEILDSSVYYIECNQTSENTESSHSKDSISHTQTDSMQTLINQTSTQNPLQLFLTDYANLYVCKVVSISKDKNVPAPAYYDEKGLCVEFWFEISDMQELVRNNFANVRDMFLANFKTLHNNRTFALYGNDYTYPLAITMKKHRDYFATFHANKQPILHYHNMFKTQEQIQMRNNLIDFIFGENLIYDLLTDSAENLINAELEYHANKGNPLYDCTGIVMLYSKTMEQEIGRFCKKLFKNLDIFETSQNQNSIGDYTYKVQGIESSIKEWLDSKALIMPNLGTLNHLLNTFRQNIYNFAKHGIKDSKNIGLMYFIAELQQFIRILQPIRNTTAHATKANLKEVLTLRKQILGIGSDSILVKMMVVYLALP